MNIEEFVFLVWLGIGLGVYLTSSTYSYHKDKDLIDAIGFGILMGFGWLVLPFLVILGGAPYCLSKASVKTLKCLTKRRDKR